MTVLIIGAPLRHNGRVYNCAVVVHRGRILGVIPKTYLPSYREFCEGRHFFSGAGVTDAEIAIGQMKAPSGVDLLFEASDVSGLIIGGEICEDMWIPVTLGSKLALAGATVLANLSRSPITIGRALSRDLLSRSCSARCLAAHVYAAAGTGESTTDLAWDGQTSIFENGVLLAEGKRFLQDGQITYADIDLDLLRQERSLMGTFDDNRRHEQQPTAGAYRRISDALEPPLTDVGFFRTIDRFPFVPSDQSRLDQDCYESYNIQVAGLVQRLRATGRKRVVIGVSGGLDSTHALIVAAKSIDLLGLPRSNILAYTLPGFATGKESKALALALMQALGVGCEELDIRPAATQMLKDIGHQAAHPLDRGPAARPQSGRLRELRGFGVKSEQKLAAALGKPRAEKRFKLSQAEAEAEALLNHLRPRASEDNVVVAGSYRRRRETVGDLDLLMIARDGSAAGDKLAKYENVTEVFAHGSTRTTVVLRSGETRPRCAYIGSAACPSAIKKIDSGR